MSPSSRGDPDPATNEVIKRQYDPFSLEVLADPYPWYAWLRETTAAYHVPETDIWVITRAADVEPTLRNHTVFSSTGGVGPEWVQRPMMSMYDPPEHTRLRRMVSGYFTPKFVEQFRPQAEATAMKLVDAFLEKPEGDFVADVAEPLVATLIADLLGIPNERRADFRRWSQATVLALATGLTPDETAQSEATRVEFVKYLKEVAAARRAEVSSSSVKTTDLISLLVAAGGQETLKPSEVTAFCVLLLVAGFETTVNGLANIMYVFMTRPEVWSAIQGDRSLLRGAVEEALRIESPVQAFFRNTLKETTVDSVVIPERSKVMVAFGSANRDPARYDDPESYRLDRKPSDHLSFGAGVHHCIGAPLARMQYEVVLQHMLGRVRTITPAGEGATRTLNVLMRGFRRLPLVMHAG